MTRHLPSSFATLALLSVFTSSCAEEEGSLVECPVGLAPGDVVITEVLANPAGPDRGREWFELYNASARSLELGGFVLTHGRQDGSDERRHRMRGASVEAGQFFVVGDAAPRELPLHVDYGYGSALGLLRNSGGRLGISCGSLELSSVVFGAMADGVAWGFDGNQAIGYAAASDYDNWCRAETEYAPGDFGTPGGPNDGCGVPPPTTHCQDAEGLREVRPPKPGDLVITEIMPSSGAVPDARGEWLEIQSFADVDLTGLEIALDGSTRLTLRDTEGACLESTEGSFVLLARHPDATENGGLPFVDFTFSFFLPNSGERLLSLHAGDELIDEFAYAGAQVRKGQSIARDLDTGETCVTEALPEMLFGEGDYGSPRAENSPCPGAGPLLEEGSCESDGIARPLRVPAPGEVRISEIMPNPGVRSDADGEWLELAVLADLDLNGLQIRLDGGTRTRTLEAAPCLEALAGSFVLLGRHDDPLQNGGLPPVDFTYSFFLPNSGQRVLSLHHGEELIDLLVYETEHVRSGVSAGRDRASGALCLTPRDESFQFGDGDYGTPGAENPVCLGEGEPSPVGEGECEDDAGIRPVRLPEPGEIFIVEILANNASPLLDRDGEWFELEVLADVDLNGLELFHDGQSRFTMAHGRCAHFQAGTRVLFARNADAELNGGLPPVDFTFQFNIVNRASSLALYSAGELLDYVEYPNPPSGRSAVRDLESGALCHSPREPELEYFPNNFGSPGTLPPACP